MGLADRELGEHSGRVVARQVADELISPGSQVQGDPARGAGLDSLPGAFPTAAGRLTHAVRLVDPGVSTDRATASSLLAGERKDHQFMSDAAVVCHEE